MQIENAVPMTGMNTAERLASLRAASILKFSLGVVYLHFGFLKFYPDLSPAESLATQTIMTLTGHRLDANQALFVIALFETVIGLGFLFGVLRRTIFALFTFHMLGTLTPLFLLPEFAFKIAPLAPTLEGQYIIKNIVFLAAGWTILLPDALAASNRPVAIRQVQSSTVSRERQFCE